MYRYGKRLSDKEIQSAVAIVGDVRVQTSLKGNRVVREALMTECASP